MPSAVPPPFWAPAKKGSRETEGLWVRNSPRIYVRVWRRLPVFTQPSRRTQTTTVYDNIYELGRTDPLTSTRPHFNLGPRVDEF